MQSIWRVLNILLGINTNRNRLFESWIEFLGANLLGKKETRAS